MASTYKIHVRVGSTCSWLSAAATVFRTHMTFDVYGVSLSVSFLRCVSVLVSGSRAFG